MIDLKKIMSVIGVYHTRELRNNIKDQTDLNGKNFIPVKMSTAISRQSRNNRTVRDARASGVKGRISGTRAVKSVKGAGGGSYSGGLDFKRLLFTRRFSDGAFRYIPDARQVRVIVWPGTYPGSDLSFRDIVRYNNRGSASVNRNILMPPKIFPVNDADVRGMKSYRDTEQLLNSPGVRKYVIDQVAKDGLKKFRKVVII